MLFVLVMRSRAAAAKAVPGSERVAGWVCALLLLERDVACQTLPLDCRGGHGVWLHSGMEIFPHMRVVMTNGDEI